MMWVMVTTSEWRLKLVKKWHQVKVVTFDANCHANTRLTKHGRFSGTKIKSKDASGLFEILTVYRLIAETGGLCFTVDSVEKMWEGRKNYALTWKTACVLHNILALTVHRSSHLSNSWRSTKLMITKSDVVQRHDQGWAFCIAIYRESNILHRLETSENIAILEDIAIFLRYLLMHDFGQFWPS